MEEIWRLPHGRALVRNALLYSVESLRAIRNVCSVESPPAIRNAVLLQRLGLRTEAL